MREREREGGGGREREWKRGSEGEREGGRGTHCFPILQNLSNLIILIHKRPSISQPQTTDLDDIIGMLDGGGVRGRHHALDHSDVPVGVCVICRLTHLLYQPRLQGREEGGGGREDWGVSHFRNIGCLHALVVMVPQNTPSHNSHNSHSSQYSVQYNTIFQLLLPVATICAALMC